MFIIWDAKAQIVVSMATRATASAYTLADSEDSDSADELKDDEASGLPSYAELEYEEEEGSHEQNGLLSSLRQVRNRSKCPHIPFVNRKRVLFLLWNVCLALLIYLLIFIAPSSIDWLNRQQFWKPTQRPPPGKVDTDTGVEIWNPFGSHSHPITDLSVKSCWTPRCDLGDDWIKVPRDLNRGEGMHMWQGFYVFMFYKRREGVQPILDIQVARAADPEKTAKLKVGGYTKIEVNLNSGRYRSEAVYMWYHAGEGQGIINLDILYGSKPGSAFGFEVMEDDLAQGTRAPAWLIYSRTGLMEAPRPILRFHSDGKFKILQVADMHFSTGAGTCLDISPKYASCQGDEDTLEFMIRLLAIEKPDLVVFTGDQLNGGSSYDSKSAIYKFARLMAERKQPFATVYGNHDGEGDLSREEMMDILEQLPYCLSTAGPSELDGVGNYVLQILAPDSDLPLFNNYFIDSGSYSYELTRLGYDWIHDSQIQWFLETSRNVSKPVEALSSSPYSVAIEPNPPHLNALAFFHIPLINYAMVENITGSQQEGVGSARIDSGFFRELLRAGDVRATFTGHDHINDYCGELLGVHLCYGGGSGYSAYGKLGFERRSRVIEITGFGSSVKTYKRLDEVDRLGGTVDEQVLF